MRLTLTKIGTYLSLVAERQVVELKRQPVEVDRGSRDQQVVEHQPVLVVGGSGQLAGHRVAVRVGEGQRQVHVRADSALVIDQVDGYGAAEHESGAKIDRRGEQRVVRGKIAEVSVQQWQIAVDVERR